MKSDLNLIAWKIMENEWDQALNMGKTVKVEINPIYNGTSKRPVAFEVDEWINGVKVDPRKTFLN